MTPIVTTSQAQCGADCTEGKAHVCRGCSISGSSMGNVTSPLYLELQQKVNGETCPPGNTHDAHDSEIKHHLIGASDISPTTISQENTQQLLSLLK